MRTLNEQLLALADAHGELFIEGVRVARTIYVASLSTAFFWWSLNVPAEEKSAPTSTTTPNTGCRLASAKNSSTRKTPWTLLSAAWRRLAK